MRRIFLTSVAALCITLTTSGCGDKQAAGGTDAGTATSASSPLSNSVLPTARFGSGRPNSRFSSRTRRAASVRGTAPDEASRSALSTP